MSHADFMAECDRLGWTMESVGSVLITSAHPAHFAATLDRVRDCDAYAMRHFRP